MLFFPFRGHREGAHTGEGRLPGYGSPAQVSFVPCSRIPRQFWQPPLLPQRLPRFVCTGLEPRTRRYPTPTRHDIHPGSHPMLVLLRWDEPRRATCDDTNRINCLRINWNNLDWGHISEGMRGSNAGRGWVQGHRGRRTQEGSYHPHPRQIIQNWSV